MKKKTKDLGTYFVRVEFENGDGFIMEWNTGGRFIGGGTETWTPLNSTYTKPIYQDEEDLIENIEYMFLEGNYSCDCNKKLFIKYAKQEKVSINDGECGDILKIKSLIVISPKGKKIVLV